MKVRRWIITVVLCLLVLAALAGYKTVQIRKAIAFGESFPEPSATVEMFIVKPMLVTERINTIGEIVAPQHIALRNELEGRITAVNFRAGDSVSKGQLLLQLDIAEEQARLKAARARAELARLDLKRAEKLRANNTVSEERLDQARAQYDVTLADIEAQQSIINKKTLTAPFDGYAGLHQLEVGELIAANTLITTLVGENAHTWVDFQLPVLQAADANIGDPVSISLPGRNAEALSGKIIAKDPALSASSRKLGFRAELPNAGRLNPNTIVNLSLEGGGKTLRPLIPITSLRKDQMGDYVYLLEPDTEKDRFRARRQTVTTGTRQNGFVSILQGLNGGEKIAVHGAFKLREGLLVYVKERTGSEQQATPQDAEQP